MGCRCAIGAVRADMPVDRATVSTDSNDSGTSGSVGYEFKLKRGSFDVTVSLSNFAAKEDRVRTRRRIGMVVHELGACWATAENNTPARRSVSPINVPHECAARRVIQEIHINLYLGIRALAARRTANHKCAHASGGRRGGDDRGRRGGDGGGDRGTRG
jgi:hypothetical protein